MDIRPIHPLFVGEVTGLDLREPIDAVRLAELTAALDNYRALAFRGQSLDDEAQMRFSALFGPLETTIRGYRPGSKLRLDNHLADISNLDESGKIVELAVREVIHGREVKNIEALANPEALDLFRDRAELKH